MKLSDTGLWFGDISTLAQVVRGSVWATEHPEHSSSKAAEEDYDLLEELVDSIYQQEANVAVVNVSGPLTNEDSFWNILFGLTSYNTISSAVKRALDDDSVTDIVLAMDTGGGDVNGLSDLSANLSIASRQKPIYAWSGSRSLSAGYWISSVANKIYGTKMSEWGSVGVITTHASLAEMYERAGIDITLIRGGKYKALGHPAEPLSAEAKRILQNKTDVLYGFFLDHVSSQRSSLKLSEKDDWAEGKIFFADEALELGLIDGVASLNEVVNSLRVKEEEVERPGITGNIYMSEGRDMPKKVVLSETDQALVASGVGLDEVTPIEVIDEPEVEASDETEVEATAEETEEEMAAPAEETSLVSYLKDELSKAQTQTSDLQHQLKSKDTEIASLKASEELLKPLVCESVQRMQIGLGQTPMDLSNLPAATVAEQYSSVRTELFKRFPGQKKSLGAEESPVPATAEENARKIGIVPKS